MWTAPPIRWYYFNQFQEKEKIQKNKKSNNQLRFAVVLTELFRGAAFPLLEDAVEVGEIVEATVVADLADGVGGVNQQTGGIPEADVDDVVGDGLTGT